MELLPPVVGASLGAMGSLAGKLDALLDTELKVEIGKLGSNLQRLSEARDPPVKATIWMNDVRELSYDMDSCVDVAEPDWIETMSGFKARVKEANEQYDRYMLGSISFCTDIATDFQISMVVGQRRPDLAVVGLHAGWFSALRQWLTDDDKALKVASIVGVGGIGKTTLAKQLWREHKPGGYFACRAFVRTAKKPDMRRILRSVLAQVRPHQPPDTNEVHELIHDIRQHLQGKRYFLIIDDLWATSVWDVARRAFPEGNGSRIITTTEIKKVALACCSYQSKHIFKMEPLSVSHSRDLFISGVFGSGEQKSHQSDEVSEEIIREEKSRQLDEVSEEIIREEKPHQLDKVWKEIIRRCAGLPLAVISISSVLASQGDASTVQNWEQIQKQLPTNTTPVEVLKQVLNFCYNCLPSCLQTCLLYLSIYPENYMILKEDIMKQWVAECFIIAPTENEKMKVAGNYFDKLVSMGLIQHIDVDYSNEVYYYAVHPMVHDLITSKSREQNFTTVIDYSERTVGSSNKVSRLSLQFGSATYATTPESIGLSQVRSLSFIGLKSCYYSSILEFKVLRFLILHMWADQPSTGVDLKPTSELVLLRSLKVTCNDTVHLPDLMQGPKHLETLEINARVAAIPSKIVHLRSWLHLRLGVGTELTDLTGILKNDTMNPTIALDESSSPPDSVMTMELLSPIFGIPKWTGKLTNLCILKFVLGELQSDDINNLQGLPLLTVLSLDVQRPTTGPIGFARGEFDALEYFEFRCGVLRLAFEEGAMRNLQRLRLGFNANRGEQYDDWVDGIEHLSNVKQISGIIGVGTGAEQRDFDNAQSAFMKAVGKHGGRIVSLKRADMVEELYVPAEKHHEIEGEHPSASSGQPVSPKQESQFVWPSPEKQHEIFHEIELSGPSGEPESPTHELQDERGLPEKQHEIPGKQPSTSSEQPGSPTQDYQKEIKQDSSSDSQFINRMPSLGAPSSKEERSAAGSVVGMTKSVVNGMLTMAQAAIEEDAKLRQSVQRNLSFITGEFQMMRSFLMVADSDRLENLVVRAWLQQIRDLAYDVEDCIEFVVHPDKKSSWWIRLVKPVSRLTPCVYVQPPLDEAVDELDLLKARVEDVSRRNVRYNLISDSGSKTATTAHNDVICPSPAGSQYDVNKGMEINNAPTNNNELSISNKKKEAVKKWIDEHPLVGRESEMKDLGLKVIQARHRSYQVMSVWGIAGVGKSALVKNMFCDRILKGKLFQKYGWMDVSQPLNLGDFSRTLLSNLGFGNLQASGTTADLWTMGSKNPIVECREIMKKHKCLVVIDGLQSREEWDLIKAALVSGSHHQNVIIAITTDQEIATHCSGEKGDLVFNVKGLKADAAFELFEKVSKKCQDAEIRELTSMCGGLPKVIVEIAGSFAKNTDRWKHALSTNNKFMQELENNREFDSLRGLFGWMNSYFRNCQDSLKPCILYLPIFPRNQLIRRRRLVRRWIAEGCSRDSQEGSAEMSGEKQFCDLLNLSIIQQPSALGLGDTRMIFCQVNGFFREYIASHQMEKNFVFELSGSCAVITQRTVRHLVISESWVRDQIVFESISFSRLRSLTVFGKWESFFISESMKVLRVLDLEDASEIEYSDLKKMVKLLRRLKFLSLRGCHEICHLPGSIGDLRQLQSLDVRHTSIVTLPVDITKLHKLQYIRAGTTGPAKKAPPQHHLLSRLSNYRSGRHLVGVEVPPGIGKLTALHTLGVVNISASGTKAILQELKKLTQLHKLGVSGINKNNSNKFFFAISILIHLESLSVQLEDNNEGCLDGVLLPLKNLRSLKLYGLGDRLPNWREQLTMLTKMDLEIAKLTEDHVYMQSEGVTPAGRREPTRGVIKFLSELPSLCILRLRVKQLQNDQLNVSIITNDLEEDSFKKMKIFEIACSSNSSSKVTFGEKAMKKLEQLKVDCCSGSLFFGLKHLRELKEVLLKGASDKALKADLITKLENHPKQKKPVVKMEEPLRSDRSRVQG